jgi:ABC-type cobalamin/Fe3+-siderophores transport system ATPase subunit
MKGLLAFSFGGIFMIKEIRFSNWKSFSNAKLPIDPLTVLIGTNASGKSNALDGLAFLNLIALGRDFQAALTDDPKFSGLKGVRGGVDWAALKPGNQFMLEALAQDNENTDYLYSITINIHPLRVEVNSESLTRIKYIGHQGHQLRLYWTDQTNNDNPSITARLYNQSAGKKKECRRSVSILSQLKDLPLRQEIEEGVNCVTKALSEIFILDPIPSLMRDFSRLSNTLASDASNIAGVLAALPKDEKKRFEETITKYVRRLPEKDIRKVWAETVGRLKNDAMLYCTEDWANNLIVDARGMSDGTLRFIAILTALLTRPYGSLIVIEEVDNGLHPSRSELLLEMLRNIGSKRNIDILVTTHNPALLDVLGPEMLPFIVVSHRDTITGESRLTLLEDIKNLPKLLASGSLGRLTAKGNIERSLGVIKGAGK